MLDWHTRARRIEAVCARHGVELPAAALHFPLAHPIIASIIPGALAAAEVVQNAERLRRPIPAELWDELRKVQSEGAGIKKQLEAMKKEKAAAKK